MGLQTNLKSRLRNTSLPKTHGLMPVFRAVVARFTLLKKMAITTAGCSLTLSVQALTFHAVAKGTPTVQRPAFTHFVKLRSTPVTTLLSAICTCAKLRPILLGLQRF